MWDLESTLPVSFHRKIWARVPCFICQGSSLCCLVGELSQLSALYVLSSLSVLPQAHMVSWMFHFIADTYTWLISQSTEQWLAVILINISATYQTLSGPSFSIVMFCCFSLFYVTIILICLVFKCWADRTSILMLSSCTLGVLLSVFDGPNN